MQGLIIFKGRYGATAQYATWLGEKLKLQVAKAGDRIEPDLATAEFVVIGTSVYIGKLQIADWLQSNLSSLLTKKIFLFVVCGTPPSEKEKLESYLKNGIPAILKNNCTVFFLPGRLRIAQLSWKDRFMLKMGARLSKDIAVKKSMLTDYDDVKKENLLPIVSAATQYCSAGQQVLHVSRSMPSSRLKIWDDKAPVYYIYNI